MLGVSVVLDTADGSGTLRCIAEDEQVAVDSYLWHSKANLSSSVESERLCISAMLELNLVFGERCALLCNEFKALMTGVNNECWCGYLVSLYQVMRGTHNSTVMVEAQIRRETSQRYTHLRHGFTKIFHIIHHWLHCPLPHHNPSCHAPPHHNQITPYLDFSFWKGEIPVWVLVKQVATPLGTVIIYISPSIWLGAFGVRSTWAVLDKLV